MHTLQSLPSDWWSRHADAWATLFSARKGGSHHLADVGVASRLRLAWESASQGAWYYLVAVLGLLVAMDVSVFQHFPETAYTNLLLLLFWILVGAGLAVEVWLRMGPTDCKRWCVGYLLEFIFSVDRVFMALLVASTLEIPRRLMAKAMFVTLLGSWALRALVILGCAPVAEHPRILPYLTGLWLVYCGARQVASHKGADYQAGVTETLVVRVLRRLLGSRLGEYYDEEGERIFMVGKQGFCMTLLGAVIICLLASDWLLSLDVALLKSEKMTNAFLELSSSAVAAFAIRALFFVVRDVFDTHGLAKYSLGPILIFLGVEDLISRELYVNALLSCSVACSALGIAVALSCFSGGPEPKPVQ